MTFVAQRTSMRPPPGRQRLSREFIARHQRARIVAALAEETMDKGYRAVTVADIVRRAGIARNTFYDNFSSKEDCFLATQDFAVEETLAPRRRRRRRGRGLGGPPRRRPRRLPQIRRERARPRPHLHRRGALRRRRRAGALRAVAAGLHPAAARPAARNLPSATTSPTHSRKRSSAASSGSSTSASSKGRPSRSSRSSPTSSTSP